MPRPGFFIAAFFCLWLQTSVWNLLALGGARPDFLLILAALLALYSEEGEWPLNYWLLGFLKDLFSSGALGLYALLFTLAALAIARARNEIFREHPLNRAFLVFTASILTSGPVAVVQSFTCHQNFFSCLLEPVLWEGLYTAVLAPFFMSFLMLFKRPLILHTSRDLSRAI